MIIPALLLAAQLSPFDQVVASERAFAAASLEKGFHEAFLANLAPDAIGFMPLPEPARPKHEGKPPTSTKLTWGPKWVAVSSAADLALSTGPWEVKHDKEAVVNISTGIFFSVWRRQPDGSWKVAVDSGIASPEKFVLPKKVENGFAGVPATPPKPGGAEKAEVEVMAAEQALRSAGRDGLAKAIEAVAAPDIRVYREGKAPGIGTASARALLASDTRRSECAPDKVVASASGDLAYAYGKCLDSSMPPPRNHGYLHVWRLQADGSWKLLADVTP